MNPASPVRDAASGASTANDASTGRYFQVVFIWLKDAATFSRYLELAAPVVGRYGGALERMLVPDTVIGEGLSTPDVVNIVSYDSQEAFAALDADPDFQQVVPLRSAAIDMIAIDGRPIGGTFSEEGLADRIYLVEMAQFGPSGMRGYANLEAEVEPLLRSHGYHVERLIAPDAARGLPFSPDVVKVAYFDHAAGLEAWRLDSAHPRIEQELYPAAVQQSIWLTARVHPMTLSEQR